MYDPDLIVRFYGLRVGKSRARYVTVLCVYHFEHTPSLTLWRDSQRFLCHGCQKTGTLAELVAHLDLEPPPPQAFQPAHPEQLRLPLFDEPF